MSQGSSPIYGNRAGAQPNALLQALMRSGTGFSGHERNCVYLNLGSGSFTNASGISGLDFQDDGRSIGVVDWDRDGDLDLWLKNRSGPQLRLMENRFANRQAWINVGLEGRTCNRDAIGSRVEVTMANQNAPKLIKTLRAGEGFLSQGSKRLHFGLGACEEIVNVVVHWPGGAAESFGPLPVRRRYLLVQGAGKAKLDETPSVQLNAGRSLRPNQTAGPSRILLSQPLPLPEITYLSSQGQQASVGASQGARLLVLWSTTCAPCLQELKELGRHAERLEESRLELLALCVDPINDDEAMREIENTAARLNFLHPVGSATMQGLERLQLVNEWVHFRTSSMSLPSSFLIDENGRLRAIYRGRLNVDMLLNDLRTSRNTVADQARNRFGPFPGRWKLQERSHRPLWIASKLLEMGDLVTAVEYVRANEELAKSDADFGAARLRLGMLLLSIDRISSAKVEIMAATQAMPNSVDAHVALGTVEYLLGNSENGRRCFARSQTIDAERANALLVQAEAELARRGVSIPAP